VVTCLVLALVAGITACCYCCYKRQRTVHSVVRLQLGSHASHCFRTTWRCLTRKLDSPVFMSLLPAAMARRSVTMRINSSSTPLRMITTPCSTSRLINHPTRDSRKRTLPTPLVNTWHVMLLHVYLSVSGVI